MRDRDLYDQTEGPETAIVRRMRARRRIRIETGDSILFDVAAYRLDRELGIAEHIAVEGNLRIVIRWPDIIFENAT